ncbi:MAG: MoxR family ATPase [Deltaproteobacteria bacterium]|nr:MoxR family ATPase [Deltaproteobacteria bacterium]
MGYPDKKEELAILERFQKQDPLADLEPVANPKQLSEIQHTRRNIRIAPPIKDYITDIVRATRNNRSLRFGASPRGSLGLMRAAQALAAIRDREYVLPDDIKYLALPVLAHRLILKEEERLRGETPERFLKEIINQIPVPAPTE